MVNDPSKLRSTSRLGSMDVVDVEDEDDGLRSILGLGLDGDDDDDDDSNPIR